MTAAVADAPESLPAATEAVHGGPLGYAAPLRALDDAIWLDDTLVVSKSIVADDPYLEGHYPDFTIYPGVFTIETVYQAAVLALTGDAGSGGVEILRIDSVRFQAPLLPGDTLTATLSLAPVSVGPDAGTPDEPEAVAVRARCRRSDGAACASVRMVVRRADARGCLPSAPAAARPPRPPAGPPVLDHTQVRALLPHRNPMLHVDAVETLEPGRRIVAHKAVSAAEACYRDTKDDTDPADLRYPLSLLVESLGQAGGLLWLASAQEGGDATEGTLVFGSAQDLTVHGRALPGDVLRHEVELTGIKGDAAFMRGRTLVGDQLVIEVEHILVLLRTPEALAPQSSGTPVPAARPDTAPTVHHHQQGENA